jgi:hypothetical protein
MKLNILLSTTEYRGDHSADVFVGIDADPKMSIEELAKRITGLNDHIEIRIAYPAIAARSAGKGE